MRGIVAAILTILAVIPLAAQAAAPVIIPTRDVDVLYQSAQGGKPVEQRLRWDAQDRLLRVDSPSPGLWMLVNYSNRIIYVVSDLAKSILQMPATTGPLPGQPGGADYKRKSSSTIAGLSCINWQTTDDAGTVTVACLTADGVLLRVARGDAVLIQAVHVAYGPQAADLFKLPGGYARGTAPATQVPGQQP